MKPLETAIAALLMKTTEMDATKRRNWVLSAVSSPSFIEFYFKPKFYKNKENASGGIASYVTPQIVSKFVDHFIANQFCAQERTAMHITGKVTLPHEMEHPEGVHFNFAAEMRKMRADEARMREQQQEEQEAAEMERRANSNCLVRLCRAIKETVQANASMESFCLVTVNVIMVGLLAYAIQLLVVRFKFFAEDIDQMTHDLANEADDAVEVPGVIVL